MLEVKMVKTITTIQLTQPPVLGSSFFFLSMSLWQAFWRFSLNLSVS